MHFLKLNKAKERAILYNLIKKLNAKGFLKYI